MNDDDQLPEITPSAGISTSPHARDDIVAEDQPITNCVAAIETILRQPKRLIAQLRRPSAPRLITQMLGASLLCTSLYGVVVGSFAGGSQWYAAPLKISAGLVASALICLPSLYIFAGLGGSRARLSEIIGLLAGLLLLSSVLLIGFAPVAWVFSQSTDSIAWMGFLHLAFWIIAIAFGMRFLRAGLVPSGAAATAGLNVWLVVFLLVSLQMTTALRPILGTADTLLPLEKKFFVAHWLDTTK